MRIVVYTTRLDPFLDSLHASGLLSASHSYRLAGFDTTYLEVLVEQALEDLEGDLVSDVAGRVLDLTGGQAALTSRALRELKPIAASLTEGNLADRMRLVEERLRLTPPHAVNLWKQELSYLLEADRALVGRLRAYLKDGPIDPRRGVHIRERALLVAGWVDTDRFGRWGLRSRLHGVWAKEVLEQMGVT